MTVDNEFIATGYTELGQLKVNNTIVSTSDLYGNTNKKVAYESDLLDKIYPVGSIYMSANSASPATLFGGTWQQLKDRFLIGAGSSYENGATGGATSHTHTTAAHKLTVDEMPSHTHIIRTAVPGNAPASINNHGKIAGAPSNAEFITSDYTQQNFNATGGNTSHSHGDTGSSSNMPPYLAVYMWKRTA